MHGTIVRGGSGLRDGFAIYDAARRLRLEFCSIMNAKRDGSRTPAVRCTHVR